MSEHFKKMVLVDPKVLDVFKSTPLNMPSTTPMARVVTTLDEELRNILDNENIPSYDKVKLYNQSLNKFNMFYNREIDRPLKVDVSPPTKELASAVPPKPADPTPAIEESTADQRILERLPAKIRKKGELLLNDIKKNPAYTYDNEGRLSYQNKLVEGSNMIDLLTDVLNKKRAETPKGFEIFARALRESNVSRTLVPNTERWRYIQRNFPPTTATSAASHTRAVVDEDGAGDIDTTFITPKKKRYKKRPTRWEPY